MKFRLLSDIHNEFEPQKDLMESGGMVVPALGDDDDTVLVLAGDIALAARAYTYENFIQRVAAQFKYVIWINGNHEFYHSSFSGATSKIKANLTLCDVHNVHYGDRFTIIIDDTAFICATLWSDMDHERDPTAAYTIAGPTGLNDFKIIRNGPKHDPYKRRLTVLDCVADFKLSKQFIFDELAKHQAAGLKTVVVTHHGPSYMSVAPCFRNDNLNPAYVTELSEDILAAGGPNVWVHGHTHHSFDYMIGDVTRVVCNPRGYVPHDYNPDFDPKKVIEL